MGPESGVLFTMERSERCLLALGIYWEHQRIGRAFGSVTLLHAVLAMAFSPYILPHAVQTCKRPAFVTRLIRYRFSYHSLLVNHIDRKGCMDAEGPHSSLNTHSRPEQPSH